MISSNPCVCPVTPRTELKFPKTYNNSTISSLMVVLSLGNVARKVLCRGRWEVKAWSKRSLFKFRRFC